MANRRADNLREFIDMLEDDGELLRIKKRVSPEIEISKITDSESKKPGGGKALLFENVVDNGKKSFPVATNLFGSDRRMSMALGVQSLKNAGDEISDLVQSNPPRSLPEFFDMAKKAVPLLGIAPKKSRRPAPCQEIVKTGDAIDLSEIPVLKCWPHDAGRFITLPLVFTKSPDGEKRNLGMYRLQVFDKNTTGMHWHIHKDASHFFNEYEFIDQKMPVAVAIGADPATIYAATAPMPRGVDELLLSGFFRKKGVTMVDCKTIDMQVPAEAEFVLEGYVDCQERRLEGPFGDHTGYYSPADMYPVFHLTAITRRERPIYCATLVGPPPMEDCYMAKATERIFLPLIKCVMPEIRDYFLPWEGVFHNIAVVSIKKEYPAHAQKVMSGLWGQGQMSFCKCIVVVDDFIDPSDLKSVWELFLDGFDPCSDIFMSYGVLDVLDHSAPSPLMGAKIGIDLTRRTAGETPRRASLLGGLPEPDLTRIESSLRQNLDAIISIRAHRGFLAIAMDKNGRNGRNILKSIESLPGTAEFFRCIAIFDGHIDISDKSALLWKIFNNVDPSRDIIIGASGTCLVDACSKNPADGHLREWPEELSFDK